MLVDLAIHTGLRRSELANLKVEDIDLERQVLVVRQGKGLKDRIIPLSKNVADKLKEYIKNKDKSISLFGLAPASISGKIKTFATECDKQIIIGCIGYSAFDGVNKFPWEVNPEAPNDNQEQADCYQVAFEMLWEQPRLKGIYWYY